jgi:hypothetical protein
MLIARKEDQVEFHKHSNNISSDDLDINLKDLSVKQNS